LADPIFRALELSIGSAVDGKNVGAREDIGDDLDSFFEPNFRNMECLFMFKGVVLKLAAGERVTVVMVKAPFGRCKIGRVFKQRGPELTETRVFIYVHPNDESASDLPRWRKQSFEAFGVYTAGWLLVCEVIRCCGADAAPQLAPPKT
jgi:hypothetical protein